ncbi:endonuclease/exonuclease/phosphatase family protein [Heyndrickxia sp. MSNUG]|uniref:endonuclease/exonuclease/phosphatase family protein n=1 Tax=Heyndrickxia sp. MSNUG TaxID=3136677 RepID=UPI003C2C8AB2
MKLLTLNCHSWQEDNQLEKIKILAETIAENDYGVIALQEVSQRRDSPIAFGAVREDNFALVLVEELRKLGAVDYRFTWDFAHLGYEVYEEGLAILTKHKIEEEYSFFISRGQDQSYWKTRKIVGAKINVDGQPVSFYSCHLGWWHDEEEPYKFQADSLLEQVKNDGVFFLMGDFNNAASVRGEGYDYLLDQGLYDTFELAVEKDSGVTIAGNIAGWEENKQDLRIDLILTGQLVEPQYSRVIFNGKNKPVVSDHYGVEVAI